MASARRLALLGLLALLGVGATAPSPAAAEPAERPLAVEYEDGAQAPAHGWSQEDGCPARTGASAARALRGPLERVWKAPATDGTIAGEPLAWKERVFVEEKSAKRRVVRVLSAATGQERTRIAAETPAPMCPSVGDGRLLVRTSPTTVEGLSLGEASLTRRWKIVAKQGIGGATMLRDEVYVVRDGVLERWTYGAAAPTWPKTPDASDAVHVSPAASPAGGEASAPRYARPSLRGASVFVTSGKELLEVERASGSQKSSAPLEEEVDPDTSRIVVASGEVFVRRGVAAPAGQVPGGQVPGGQVPGGQVPGGQAHAAGAHAAPDPRFLRMGGSLEAREGIPLPAGLACVGVAWVGVVESEGVRRLVGGRAGEGDPYVFAGEGLHDEFVTATPPTIVVGAVYVGLRGFAFPSLTVLRASPPATASRAVPLRDRILVAETPALLSEWREVKSGDERLAVKPAGAVALSWKGCRAAIDDGRVLEGPFAYDPKTSVFKSTKAGELASCPARSVHAVLTCDVPRKLLLAGAPADAAAGVAAIVRAETATTVLTLVPMALAAGDAELARRAIGVAVEYGAPDAEVGVAETATAAFEASPKDREEAKAQEVETKLAALTRREVEVLFELAESLPKDASAELGAALVRAVVEREPKHEGALKWVRARLPSAIQPADATRLDDWLDFVEVRSRLKVSVWGVDAQTKRPWGTDGSTPREDSDLFRNFWSAHSTWPGDVEIVAFECGPLVVFSPLERPGAIVRCLALGRLVADTLDKTFAPMGAPRTDEEKLILHLFSTKEQYLEVTKPWGEAERSDGLENTAGHYAPGENVTRMYFPDEEDAGEVPGVYSHELTHHWIERRRPGTENGDRSSSTPGYWVVEGFADFVRSFLFDVDAQKATVENPRADHADTLAGIAPEGLIPWPKLLTMTQAEFQKLSMEDRIPVKRRWRLGPTGGTVPKVLFYDQGAATCAYLYLAEKEKYRKALLDFVYAYYEGKAQPDTLTKAIGLSHEELGKRVVAWCKELTKKG